MKSAGAFPGSPSDEPVEIPEEEWSQTDDGRPVQVPARSTAGRRMVVVAGPILLFIFALLRCAGGV